MVGTGASAIQIVPSIQPKAAKLTLFQRTPPWVMPRMDRRITGAERWLHAKLPFTGAARRGLLWGIRELQVQAFTKRPNELGLVEALAKANMTKAVKDPALRAKLTPSYRIGCKRILLSSEYYPALTQPNVDVVASGLAEVRGSTLVAADGTETEVDAIVFGTGFRVTEMPIAERVVGADGITLAEAWKDGMESLRGATAAGFPNWMTVIGPNTGLGNSSMILMIESQLNYMADFLRQLNILGGRTALAPRASAVGAWNRRVQERMKRTVWSTGGCTSWYLDANGRNTTIWPGTTREFRQATREVDLAEYEIVRQADRRTGPRTGIADEVEAVRRSRTADRRVGRRNTDPHRGPRPRQRAGRRPGPRLDLLHGVLVRADTRAGARLPGRRLRPARSRPHRGGGCEHRRTRRRPGGGARRHPGARREGACSSGTPWAG